MAVFSTFEEIKAYQKGSCDEVFPLRIEQRDAIDRAKLHYCKRTRVATGYRYQVVPEFRKYLWDAKMRFGKTICALQLMREMDVKRTLIITHRPVVGDGWDEAFKQVIGRKDKAPVVEGNNSLSDVYAFGMLSEKDNSGNFYDMEKFVQEDGHHYAFFVSMQYIRLSEIVNDITKAKNLEKTDGYNRANEKLKADILNTNWDLIIVDEAHEGTLTSLGSTVIKNHLQKETTKMLYLTGTSYNIYDEFKENEVFTWDYIAEQRAKRLWDQQHPGEKNPYAELPQMQILTYDISKIYDDVLNHEGVFAFSEFFRTWTGNPKADGGHVMPVGAKGRFVHESEVREFLDLMCKKSDDTNFPFSTDEYRQMFRHTLWVVSHVNEAVALKNLLEEHPIFKRFNIINVAGNREEDERKSDALDKVKKAIGEYPEHTQTITISCGRLTTGVTVKPWTAVFYLKGGDRAATYMQTIFRVQSPYKTKDGKHMKTKCFVFDFAPDRTLKVIAETAKFSTKTISKNLKSRDEDEMTQEELDKLMLGEFIELCPVITMDGGKMTPLDTNTIYKQLENVFVDRLVRKGFDDNCLYNMEELNKIDSNIINQIGLNGGQAPDVKRIDANKMLDLSHMDPVQREEYMRKQKKEASERAAKKTAKDTDFKKKWDAMSEAEREAWLEQEAQRLARLEQLRNERIEFKKRISNIRGIALRIPLLMYGGSDTGNTDEDLTVENFTRKISDASWLEFMPKGITKKDFNKIKTCFNATRFVEAGKKYRALTREADWEHVEERIQQITEIFSYFRNPDKETVLTPWRVVNMHMSDTIGGWCWYDESFNDKVGALEHPRFVNQGMVTEQLFDNVSWVGDIESKILEINSKTGLYPLYVTYSLYRRKLQEYINAECIDPNSISVQEEQVVWDDVVKNNMYVICNTPMAAGITRRTLLGFREPKLKVNIKPIELIKLATENQDSLVKELKSARFWTSKAKDENMKFNAVVGNPPYQVSDGGAGVSAKPVYNLFVDLSKKLNPDNVSLIMPAKWYTDGKGLGSFRETMLKDKQISKLVDFTDSRDCFDNVDIAGGVCYFHWVRGRKGLCEFISVHRGERKSFMRDLSSEETFVRHIEAIDIIYKVKQASTNFYNERVSSRKPFGLATNVEPLDFGDIELKYNKGKGPYDSSQIKIGTEMISKWKIIISYLTAEHAGQTDKQGKKRILSSLDLLEPNEICTETYLVVDAFDSKKQAIALSKYLKCCFTRFLISILASTQHLSKDKFALVPLQDFSSSSDIDWTLSVDEIDRQLYSKYRLTNEEIVFIKKMIKPME